MVPTRMIHAGEAGLTSVVEGIAKVREALPDSIREAADRRLGADSTLGKGVLAMVDTVAEESARAKAGVAELAQEVAAADPAAAEGRAVALAGAAGAVAKKSRGPVRKILLGGVVLGAASASAYVVWKRRQAAAAAHLSGETEWATATAAPSAATFQPGVADAQSPDAVDDTFAHEIDEAADEIAAEVVDGIEAAGEGAHGHVHEAPEPAEPFVPGVADEQSPDAVDETFAHEIDEVADEIAAEVVEGIETPEGRQS